MRASAILGILEKMKEYAFIRYVPSKNDPEGEGGTIEMLLFPVTGKGSVDERVSAYLRFPSSMVGIYESSAFEIMVDKSLLDVLKALRDAEIEFDETGIVLTSGSFRYRAPYLEDYDRFKEKLLLERNLIEEVVKGAKVMRWSLEGCLDKLSSTALVGKQDQVFLEIDADDGVVGKIRSVKQTGQEFEFILGKPIENGFGDEVDIPQQKLTPSFFYLAKKVCDFMKMLPTLEYVEVPEFRTSFVWVIMGDQSALGVVRCMPVGD